MENQLLNSNEIRTLQHTCALIKPVAQVLTTLFYNRLFEQSPSIRNLFKRDLYVQRAKLMATLDYLVDILDHPELLQVAAARLGDAHRAYGVRDEDYDLVGQALLWALAKTLGPGYTPEVEMAWRRLYELVAATMKTGTIRN